jgi:signal peptide peptidase SppA
MIEQSPVWAVDANSVPQLAKLPTLLAAEKQNFSAEALAEGLAFSAGPALEAERSELPISVYDNVAIIPLRGIMLKSYPWRSSYVCSSLHVKLAIRSARLDESIDHILIIADTPGGSVSGMHELGDEIKLATENKQVVVQVEGSLCSAGYHVAVGANSIIANHKMNVIGSIGVRTVLVDTSKYYEDMGIKIMPIDTGEHKSTGQDGVPVTDAQKAEIQRQVDELYAEFISVIVEGRGISEKDAKALGDGRTWFATDALSSSLIDGIQSTETTLQSLAKRNVNNTAETNAFAEKTNAAFAEFESLIE